MTSQEYADILEKDQTKEKLTNALKTAFPRYKSRTEDWAAKAILFGLRKSKQFKDRTGALAYVMEVGELVAIKDLNQIIARSKALQGEYYDTHGGKCKQNGKRLTRRSDPMRQIDFKVDLEKAIRLTTGEERMQQALWHIHFEKWTWDEVLDALPGDISRTAWNMRIARANDDLKRRLNAFGYRG